MIKLTIVALLVLSLVTLASAGNVVTFGQGVGSSSGGGNSTPFVYANYFNQTLNTSANVIFRSVRINQVLFASMRGAQTGDILYFNGNNFTRFPRPSGLPGSYQLINSITGTLAWSLIPASTTPNWNSVLSAGRISNGVNPQLTTTDKLQARDNNKAFFSPGSDDLRIYSNSTNGRINISAPNVYTRRLNITVPNGVSPLIVKSSTVNTLFNADMVDGLHASAFKLNSTDDITCVVYDAVGGNTFPDSSPAQAQFGKIKRCDTGFKKSSGDNGINITLTGTKNYYAEYTVSFLIPDTGTDSNGQTECYLSNNGVIVPESRSFITYPLTGYYIGEGWMSCHSFGQFNATAGNIVSVVVTQYNGAGADGSQISGGNVLKVSYND